MHVYTLQQLHATDYHSWIGRAIWTRFSRVVCSVVGAKWCAIFAHISPVKGGILAQICPWLYLCKYWLWNNISSLFAAVSGWSFGIYAQIPGFYLPKTITRLVGENSTMLWNNRHRPYRNPIIQYYRLL